MSTYKITYLLPALQSFHTTDKPTLLFKEETIEVTDDSPIGANIKSIRKHKCMQRSLLAEQTNTPIDTDLYTFCGLRSETIPVISIRNITSQVWRRNVTIAPTE